MCAKLDELLLAEETYCRQRSRLNYLMEIDKNTRFFHLRVSNRKRRNNITRLKDEGGLWVTDENSIRKMTTEYFHKLFTSSNPSIMEDALSCIAPCVTDAINSELLKHFTKEEVTQALSQMKPRNDVADYVIRFLDGRENITNVLVGRHKVYLDSLIEAEQSAFIPGRLISDNAIIAFESFYFLKSHYQGRKEYMSLKLDISKAYDKVEWVFLEWIMVKMEFSLRWVEMIMRCVRTVRSAVLAASGQRLNMQKSELFFSLSTSVADRNLVCDILDAAIVELPGKYFGLSAVVGRNKSVAFNPIKERIWKKIKGLERKIALIFGIEDDFARFCWGHSGEKRQIYWVSWDKLCSAKQDGGLGFRHFETFNLAMLTKQLWRLYERPQSLVSHLLSARYYPSGDFLGAIIGHHPSFIWRSLMDVLPVFHNRSRWLIGDGRKFRFWQDQWCISELAPLLLSPISRMNNSVIADWFMVDLIRWNEDLLRQHLYEFEEVAGVDVEDATEWMGASIVDWVDKILRSVREGEACKLLVLLWASWNGRNEEYHGDLKCRVSKTGTRDGKVRWISPVIGEWKINVDAGILGEMGCRLEVVVRDHTGRVERAEVQQVRDRWSPDIAEAKAAEFGLKTALQMGLYIVVLESDSSTLITMLKSNSIPANYFGRIGNAILENATSFSCIRFSFVRRDGNSMAHGMAHGMAHLMPVDYSTRFWVGAIPEHIVSLVDSDSALLPSKYYYLFCQKKKIKSGILRD
ncbi:uncharacterized protein LOC141648795 [Silene latifolia]|uniref:uncharacterized protein LOC141648795 n=1 Tax=Silene latifolia TaxID=37657 RepID=UPI003D7837DF